MEMQQVRVHVLKIQYSYPNRPDSESLFVTLKLVTLKLVTLKLNATLKMYNNFNFSENRNSIVQ